jgi:hypothetical protein
MKVEATRLVGDGAGESGASLDLECRRAEHERQQRAKLLAHMLRDTAIVPPHEPVEEGGQVIGFPFASDPQQDGA